MRQTKWLLFCWPTGSARCVTIGMCPRHSAWFDLGSMHHRAYFRRQETRKELANAKDLPYVHAMRAARKFWSSRRTAAPFVVSGALILLAVGLYVFANLETLVLYIACLASVGTGLWVYDRVGNRRGKSEHPLDLPFAIAHDPEIYDEYLAIARSLKRISQIPDLVFRDAALQQIQSIKNELGQVAAGTLTFDGTESWRLVYGALLQSQHVYLYRSVSWVRSAGYWQDEPGLESTRLNLDLVDSQAINLERIVIAADSLWPASQRFPVEPIRGWIDAHHRHGVWIKLVRESVIASEPDLLKDFGIYGGHAVGEHVLDEDCHTLRFVLKFSFTAVEEAEGLWQRLSLYSKAYQDLLDLPP